MTFPQIIPHPPYIHALFWKTIKRPIKNIRTILLYPNCLKTGCLLRAPYHWRKNHCSAAWGEEYGGRATRYFLFWALLSWWPGISYLQCSCFIFVLQSQTVMLQPPLISLENICVPCKAQWTHGTEVRDITRSGAEDQGRIRCLFLPQGVGCVLEQNFDSSQNRGCLSKFLSLLTRGLILLNWHPARCKK